MVVGSDLLGRLRVRLDRAHDVARIDARLGAGRAAGAIPLTFRDGSPHVAGLLGAPVDALFDSGDSALVSLGYAAYRAGPPSPVLGRGLASGIDRSEDVLKVQIPSASGRPARARPDPRGRAPNPAHPTLRDRALAPLRAPAR